jgi:hypothetical protein
MKTTTINTEAQQRIWEANDLLNDAINAIGQRRQDLLSAAFSIRNMVLGGNSETCKALDTFDARWIKVYAA